MAKVHIITGLKEKNKKDHFWVSQLMINGELNIVHWFRLNVGLGYRFVQAIERAGLTNGKVDGRYAGIALKFGKF